MSEADAPRPDGVSRNVSNRISDGVFFHAVLQGRNITVRLPERITPALSGLPAASAAFTGRDTHVEALLQGLAPRLEPQEAVLVAAVAGLGGIGKTELVVQTAARATKRSGWFPGGVLFVDMSGYDTERSLSPGQALDGLLRALGMPGEHIPEGLQDRSRLYRSVLAAFAKQGRRILVVIDNVSSAKQARPLLPTDGITAALLTSRHTLDVGARLHDLDTLDESSSVELLGKALFQARGAADSRVRDAPSEASTLARLCAGLPLALRIAAALLADTPNRPIEALNQALSDVHHRLDQLAREDRTVRAALDLSYKYLSEPQARLFRLVALNPGPELSTAAAAHLAATDQLHTEQCLQELARAHLVEPAPVWGRWRMHDLVRVYASERAAKETTAAHDVRRLLLYYLENATRADSYTYPVTELPPHGFSDRRHALAWLNTERENLLAAAALAESAEHADIARDLPMVLENYLVQYDYREERRAITALAVRAAHAQGDRRGIARARVALSDALRATNAVAEAITEARTAAEIFRSLGDQAGEGSALRALATGLGFAGQHEEALRVSAQAVPLLQQGSNRHIAAVALMNYGDALTAVERYDEAIDALQESLAVLSQTSRPVETFAQRNLVSALLGAGRRTQAITTLQEASTRAIEADGLWETDVVAEISLLLGNLLWEDEKLSQASHLFRQAATLFTRARNIANGITSMAREENPEAADTIGEATTLTPRVAIPSADDVEPTPADLVTTRSIPLVRHRPFDQPLAVLREPMALLRRLADEDPHDYRSLLAIALEMLAWALSQDDTRTHAALESAAEAVEIATDVARKNLDERYNQELFESVLGLSNYCRSKGWSREPGRPAEADDS